jgi:lysophospholipase L1-like esterase
MKIVFLGDSLTWGEYGGNFVDVVAEELPDDTIINEGVGGDTVVNLYRRYDTVLDKHNPDVLFVMVGGNDASSYTMPKTQPYYRSSKRIEGGIVTPHLFERTYRDLLTELQINHVMTLVGLAPTEYNPTLKQAMHEYNMLAQQVAHSMNLPTLDLEQHLTTASIPEREPVSLKFIQDIGNRFNAGWTDFETERQQYGYTHTFDGMHLMPASAQIIGKVIASFIKEHAV